MIEDLTNLIRALRCCRKENCKNCPLQLQICDELFVEMVSIPVELVKMIEKELERKEKHVTM